uniref:Putative ovule protein n=1 Tax=Solanum chacoense TaxID=4108 RepID=A0A0V0GZU8_SOLCH
MWLAVQSKLLTKDRLLRLNIDVEDSSCCMCQDSVMETSKHVFVDCEFAAKVRGELMQWIKTSLPARELKPTLELIKRKHWKGFKKQVVAAV